MSMSVFPNVYCLHAGNFTICSSAKLDEEQDLDSSATH